MVLAVCLAYVCRVYNALVFIVIVYDFEVGICGFTVM